MWPELFTIPFLDVPLRSFGLMVGTGFLVAVWFGARLAARYGADPARDPERFSGDVAFWILIGVLGGGRLAYVLLNWGEYAERPLDALKVWEGGLVMYGGLILALVLGGWKARKLGMPLWQSADFGLTAGFLGQAIGRVGCLLVGDDFGKPTDVPWAITFPDPLREGAAFPPELAGVPVHPTQIYMALKALALCGLGLWLLKRKRFHGQVTCVLLMGYALLRFVIEFYRGDAGARGGVFREGLSPAEVGMNLHRAGVADPSGRVTDFAGYRELIRSGAEGMQAELLISTSQMIGIVIFALGALGYFLLARRPQQRLAVRPAAA